MQAYSKRADSGLIPIYPKSNHKVQTALHFSWAGNEETAKPTYDRRHKWVLFKSEGKLGYTSMFLDKDAIAASFSMNSSKISGSKNFPVSLRIISSA